MFDDLPPELQSVLDSLADEPEAVHQIWQYLLVTAMIDDEKAWVVGTRNEDDRTLLQIRTITGEEFEVVRPALSAEVEAMMLKEMRQIIESDG